MTKSNPVRKLSDPKTRRRTNQALLVLVPLAIFTGLFSNTIGVDWIIDPATVHGMVALAIAVLMPWKAPIVQRGLGRHRQSRWASLVLLVLIAVTLISGLVHAAALTRKIGPLTIMQIHIGGALIALALIVAHYRSHPVPIRRTDLDRRAFIAGASVTAAVALRWVSFSSRLIWPSSRPRVWANPALVDARA